MKLSSYFAPTVKFLLVEGFHIKYYESMRPYAKRKDIFHFFVHWTLIYAKPNINIFACLDLK